MVDEIALMVILRGDILLLSILDTATAVGLYGVPSKIFEIIVPLYSRLMAQGAGKNIAGIYGTTNWNWSLQDEGSKQFVKSFGAKYGFPPSQAAHTCYVQTLLYADAVERAGTFSPPEVIKAYLGEEEIEGDASD